MPAPTAVGFLAAARRRCQPRASERPPADRSATLSSPTCDAPRTLRPGAGRAADAAERPAPTATTATGRPRPTPTASDGRAHRGDDRHHAARPAPTHPADDRRRDDGHAGDDRPRPTHAAERPPTRSADVAPTATDRRDAAPPRPATAGGSSGAMRGDRSTAASESCSSSSSRFSAIALMRATYLGSVKAGSLKRAAVTQQVTKVTMPAARGAITDRNGDRARDPASPPTTSSPTRT